MKKVVILGCENSHANTFLQFIKDGGYPEIEITGVYSYDTEAANKLKEEFGVPVMSSFDEAVGKVDGIIVTARHGDNHYKYAKPYIGTTPVMFIDKPITIDEGESLEFMKQLKENGVKVTGGSCCKHVDFIQELKQDRLNDFEGKTLCGFVRAPVSLTNDYGNFFFYSQHLVEMVLEIYGHYPKSVKAYKNDCKITLVFRYEDYDITALYVEGSYHYYAARYSFDGGKAGVVNIDPAFRAEFDEFYEILTGAEQKVKYKDFIAPVFVLNAINRAIESGKEEIVTEFDV